jgi:hypothetical protein
LCSACWQRRPERPFVQAAHLAARLANPPGWLDGFVAHLAAGNAPARACTMITELGRLLGDEHPDHPQHVLERARRPGRSMGSLARALEDHFTAEGLALPTDQAERLATGRRQRRLDAVPAPLRPAVARFCEHMLAARQRACRAGTRPRTDHTIETALAIVRDLARFLADRRGKQDWALAGVHDIEAFLVTVPKSRKRRLTVLGQFFGFARTRKIILADPTRTLAAAAPRGFAGRPSPLTSSVPCSAAGRPARRPTRTRRCWASWPCCTAVPAARSATCTSIMSTPATGRSGSASARTRCRWTRPDGRCCSAASRTAAASTPSIRT